MQDPHEALQVWEPMMKACQKLQASGILVLYCPQSSSLKCIVVEKYLLQQKASFALPSFPRRYADITRHDLIS